MAATSARRRVSTVPTPLRSRLLRSCLRIPRPRSTKTPDNLPLIGPLVGAPEGTFVCAGLSGYGVMAANAAGELLASHVARDALGDSLYADDFLPERWSREEYKGRVASGAADKGLQI